MQTIKISDKNENTLKSALEELNVSDKKSGSTKENADPNKSFVKSVQMNFSESSSIDENYIEIDVDSLLPPKTSMQFVSTWNKLTNSKMRYQYLKVSTLSFIIILLMFRYFKKNFKINSF